MPLLSIYFFSQTADFRLCSFIIDICFFQFSSYVFRILTFLLTGHITVIFFDDFCKILQSEPFVYENVSAVVQRKHILFLFFKLMFKLLYFLVSYSFFIFHSVEIRKIFFIFLLQMRLFSV